MLPDAWRIRRPSEFAAVLKNGSKGANRLMVTVVAVPGIGTAVSCTPPQLGLIVPKRVFPKAVDRNRIKRQLRHIFRENHDMFPSGTQVVIRVLPGSKDKGSNEVNRAFLDAARKALRNVL